MVQKHAAQQRYDALRGSQTPAMHNSARRFAAADRLVKLARIGPI
ncbi:hypothetical protein PLANPX_4627 [Lacipirellula parvula]|uniref:Uncharacterized protein n=1 Tax=Lacipirellula parvula TaxID=2650471 RepID=A0A5K7XF49_9BACT|nr:hypothetical protein PLANPX_4627 [Lacipirellula parvula]